MRGEDPEVKAISALHLEVRDVRYLPVGWVVDQFGQDEPGCPFQVNAFGVPEECVSLGVGVLLGVEVVLVAGLVADCRMFFLPVPPKSRREPPMNRRGASDSQAKAGTIR